MFFCQEGDILLYERAPTLVTELVEIGERLEDGSQPYEFYHVAIALGRYDKIEAQGKDVAIVPIDYNSGFRVFRPPIPLDKIRRGLAETRKLVGEPYDWLLIADEALRDATFNLVHLPEKFVQSEERRRKICSTLVAFYFRHVGFGHLKRWPRPSPEDIWLQVKQWEAKP